MTSIRYYSAPLPLRTALHDGRDANLPWMQELPDADDERGIWVLGRGPIRERPKSWGISEGDLLVEVEFRSRARSSRRTRSSSIPAIMPNVIAMPMWARAMTRLRALRQRDSGVRIRSRSSHRTIEPVTGGLAWSARHA